MTSRAQTLTTPEGRLSFTVVHRPRVTRRLHLELADDGSLRVVVPRDWPDFYTRRLLHKNLPFVRRFLRRARERQLPPLRYQDGEVHLFGGEEHVLRVTQATGKAVVVALEGDALVVRLPDTSGERVRRALRAWYLAQARESFAERLSLMQARAPWARDRQLNLHLRRMKRTWGTCRSNGDIRLNTHLVKAPVDCLDYVITHELCHLEEMNHGARFYALQESLWPSWRAWRRHLREQGGRYTRE